MPFQLVKVGPNKFYVENAITGKRYSKRPMTRAKAVKQLEILNTAYIHSGEHGGAFFDGIVRRISAAIRGPRDDYSPSVRNLLKQIGNFQITKLVVIREPVKSFFRKLTNILTLGQFDTALKKYGVDNVMHLYMVADFNDTQRGLTRQIILEKNHVLNISTNVKIGEDAKTMQVNNYSGGITINQFLENAKRGLGKDYFPYRALPTAGTPGTNCQGYIKALLQFNNLLTPELEKFIYQDMTEIAKEINPVSKKIMNGITNLASQADILMNGAKLSKYLYTY